ncbi:MAG: DUF58 domain-containing protein, partial [Anaerolineae bacterium]|nr:DUF58 domain-containing protein [Anaerolineae bacterium]
WAQVGDRLVERFTLTNEGWSSAVWAEIIDASTLPNYYVSRGTGVPARDSIRWHTEAVCLRRGLFTLGPTQVRTGDPFGIFTVTLNFPASMPLLVLPPIVPLPSIQVSPGGRSGSSRPRANATDRTVSAASVQEYVSGDSKRWIHWKTTAKYNDLFVRLFDGTPAGDWWIILDMNGQVQVGNDDDATDEHGVVLAASLADRGIRLRRSVGLVAQGQDLVWLPPAGGEGQRWEILRLLALVNRGSRPLAEVLTRITPSIGRSASLIIVTPAIDTSWVQSLIPLIRKGVVPTVLVLDPVSFGSVGTIDVVDAVLDNIGVKHYPITRDVLNQPEKQPGKQGKWEWRVLGTGKAVPVHAQRDVPWRTLV